LGKSLVITEKPSVARDIVAALDGFEEADGFWENEEYVITFSVGHLVELLPPEEVDEKWKRWTLDTLPILPAEFKCRQKAGASERVRTIKKLLKRKDVDRVVNACDAGREGELIFREILDFLDCSKPTQRLWLQSMTHEAIRAGFENLVPGEQYDSLGRAAACRSQSDWLIGMNATRALTRRLQARREKTAWSAGRVQTPTLAIVVDRELEILSHVPCPYWQLEGEFHAAGHDYSGTYFDPSFSNPGEDRDLRDDRIFEENRASQIIAEVQGQTGAARETRKASRETAPPLFDLTSLQREANRRFGWSARRTLNAAQRLYEGHKLLTYPRTSSRALPEDYRGRVDEVLRAFAEDGPYTAEAAPLVRPEAELHNTQRTFDTSKVTDHFAIIPTGKLPEAELRGDDKRLFDVVVHRFIATFYEPAVWNRVERITEIAGHSFRSRSRTLERAGWRVVIGQPEQPEQEEQALPSLVENRPEAEGVESVIHEVERIAEKTKHPARITEARLLSLMENAGQEIDDSELADALRQKGIGTPATRADVIENLIAKGYLQRLSKGLRPTVKGIRLVDVLRRIHIDRLASPELTGELEYKLNEVEHGRFSAEDFMNEIVTYTNEIVERAKTFEYDELYPDDESLGVCPSCKKPVYERSWFYRCKEIPDIEREDDCQFRIWKDKSGRYMDRGTVRLLLEKGETGELEGFTSRDGRTYSGLLHIEDEELKLEAIKGSGGDYAVEVPEYDVDDRPLDPCPLGCGSQIIETSTHFSCRAGMEKQTELDREAGEHLERTGKKLRRTKEEKEQNKPCPFILPRTVCKREITRDEAQDYIAKGRTEMLTDFTSRFGRPFGATLFIKENGRHGFEFAQRKNVAGKSTPKKKAGGKKATRKKAGRKKATRKKSSSKKATKKKS
jgi:DNA topoisomerase-3